MQKRRSGTVGTMERVHGIVQIWAIGGDRYEVHGPGRRDLLLIV
jgi:hypothetical protein